MDQLLRALSNPTPLSHYRAVMVSSKGRVLVSGDLLAADDDDALAQAQELAKEQAVDVWHGLRFVGQLDPAKPSATEAENLSGRFAPLLP